MLILGRKEGESVVIGRGKVVRVTVLEVRNGRVRLAFEADDDIAIDRSELREAIDREGRGGAA